MVLKQADAAAQRLLLAEHAFVSELRRLEREIARRRTMIDLHYNRLYLCAEIAVASADNRRHRTRLVRADQQRAAVFAGKRA